ncbi:MAG: sugar phosphate isomerase/epimerase [Chloroflexi bacterium]|nr:sugar phosphate isomerase/epimerase [Chloroflexota bacterium]
MNSETMHSATETGAPYFAISAFGDEIDADLHKQLALLQELNIGYLEFRGAWGKNVLTLQDSEVAQVQQMCHDAGIRVSCIGCPVGKTPITQPIKTEISNLKRIFEIATALGTRRVRIFSFYPPNHEQGNAGFDSYLAEATTRLARLTELAAREDFLLLLENERGIVGDIPARCHALLQAINSPHLRFLWDPANFVVVGVAQPTAKYWSLLRPYTTYIHVKDALLADGAIRAAGEGDGQIGMLLSLLRDQGYRGFLALEPHLAHAGARGGFSGPQGMAYAATQLRQLMAQMGCEEKH